MEKQTNQSIKEDSTKVIHQIERVSLYNFGYEILAKLKNLSTKFIRISLSFQIN